MANVLSCCGLEHLSNNIDLTKQRISVVAVDCDYKFDPYQHCNLYHATHNMMGLGELSNAYVGDNGNLYADDVTIIGANEWMRPFGALLIVLNECTERDSTILAYLDTGFRGLPLNCNGSDISIQWDTRGIMSWEKCISNIVSTTQVNVLQISKFCDDKYNCNTECTGHGQPIDTQDDCTIANVTLNQGLDVQIMDLGIDGLVRAMKDQFPGLWFGAPTIYSKHYDFSIVPPVLDCNGNPTCEYAMSQSANLMQMRTLCGQNRTVRWGDRSITNHNIKDLQDEQQYWSDMVKRVCGCKRRPITFGIGCR